MSNGVFSLNETVRFPVTLTADASAISAFVRRNGINLPISGGGSVAVTLTNIGNGTAGQYEGSFVATDTIFANNDVFFVTVTATVGADPPYSKTYGPFVLDAKVNTRLSTAGYTVPDNANIIAARDAATTASNRAQTILDRIGAFAGTGLNTILGFLRALANKAAALTPSELSAGGTFNNTTDSLEALRDRGDSGAWGAGGGGGSADEDFDITKATTNKSTFYAAGLEYYIVTLDIIGRGVPEVLDTAQWFIGFTSESSNLPPAVTPGTTGEEPELYFADNKLNLRLMIGTAQGGETSPVHPLTGGASGVKYKVWMRCALLEVEWKPLPVITVY